MAKYTFISDGGSVVLSIGDRGVPYALAGIEGVSPSDATINLTDMAHNHGALFSSSKVQPRTINVGIAITARAEESRLYLYKVFRPSKPVRVEYKSAALDVWIEGYVASAPVPLMDNKQVMTVEIICPDPFWRSTATIRDELTETIGAFHFPFAITAASPIPISYVQGLTNIVVTNDGAAETGFRMILHASSVVRYPKVFNYVTGEFFGLNVEMRAGDTITIDSTAGKKTVTLTRDGADTNYFNYIMQGSTWLTLEQGGNVFTYEASDESALTVTFEHYDTYTGV